MTSLRRSKGLLCAAVAGAVLAAGTLPAHSQAALGPVLEVGGTGTAAGQLDGPTGMAFAPNGDLYVAESVNRRVSQFTGGGQFVRAWGIDVIPGGATGFEVCTPTTGCKAGDGAGASASLPGAVRNPEGIDVLPNGDVVIGDTFNDWAARFTADGSFLGAFGLDVIPGGGTGLETCTAGTGCQQGDGGQETGTLGDLFDITVGPAGQVYVIHANLRRVSEFSADGNFVKAWGHDVIPGGATGFEICTTATGCKTGTSGSAAGQFDGPRGIGIADNGNVLVSDDGRIEEFTAAGEFVRAWGFDVVPANAETGLEVCTTASGCQAPVLGGGAGQLAGATNGITQGADGTVWIADTFNRRLSAYGADASFSQALGFDVIPGGSAAFEVCTAALGCKAGVQGSGSGQLNLAKDPVVDCRGAVWVADSENDRLTRFAEPGTPLPPDCVDEPAKPSNEFTIGKAKLNKKKGSARLTVSLPGAGRLELSGGSVKTRTADATAAGEIAILVEARGKAKKKLKKKGKAKVTAALTFTPTGGDPGERSAKLTLKRKRRS